MTIGFHDPFPWRSVFPICTPMFIAKGAVFVGSTLLVSVNFLERIIVFLFVGLTIVSGFSIRSSGNLGCFLTLIDVLETLDPTMEVLWDEPFGQVEFVLPLRVTHM